MLLLLLQASKVPVSCVLGLFSLPSGPLLHIIQSNSDRSALQLYASGYIIPALTCFPSVCWRCHTHPGEAIYSNKQTLWIVVPMQQRAERKSLQKLESLGHDFPFFVLFFFSEVIKVDFKDAHYWGSVFYPFQISDCNKICRFKRICSSLSKINVDG